MIIDSYDNESKKGLPVGVYSVYAMDPVHDGMQWETATVTLAQWEAKGKSGSKLPMRKPVIKFKVLKSKIGEQLALLDQVLAFANDGKVAQALRGVSAIAVISSQMDWDRIKTNCRLLIEGSKVNG